DLTVQRHGHRPDTIAFAAARLTLYADYRIMRNLIARKLVSRAEAHRQRAAGGIGAGLHLRLQACRWGQITDVLRRGNHQAGCCRWQDGDHQLRCWRCGRQTDNHICLTPWLNRLYKVTVDIPFCRPAFCAAARPNLPPGIIPLTLRAADNRKGCSLGNLGDDLAAGCSAYPQRYTVGEADTRA